MAGRPEVKKLAWCTDIHLDFLDGPDDVGRVHDEFAEPLSHVECDGIILSGDLSLAQHVVRHLGILDRIVGKPIYFVLGNHDFYGGSFQQVREDVRTRCSASTNLHYLTGADPVLLTDTVAIVGDDGWYDSRYGDVGASNLVMSDWFRISDYVNAGCMEVGAWGPRPHMGTVIAVSRKQADESADRLRIAMESAAESRSTVIVVTHVPPWPQVHRHNGKTGSPSAHPWYTSAATGRTIEEVAGKFPNVKFEVFCGHTHGKFDGRVLPNVVCHVGGSEYGSPSVAGFIQVP